MSDPVQFDALLGEGYTLWSPKAECDLSINVWRQRIESGQGSGPFTMRRSPGLLTYIETPTTGTVRGQFEINNHVFVVVGSDVYDYIGTTLNFTYHGLSNDGRNVQFAGSPNTLMIWSANQLFRINGGTMVAVATPFTPLGISSLKNLFFSISATLSQIYWSEDDGASFPADQVQAAEADANNLVAQEVIHQQLWVIGNRITQIYSFGADPNKPLVATDAGPRVGTDAARSVQFLGESLIWKVVTAEGQNWIGLTNGYGVDKVSNAYVDNLLAQLARQFGTSDCIGMVYAFGNDQFYRLTFPAADRTIEYHRNVPMGISEWEEVSWLDIGSGTLHRHRGNCIAAAFDKVLVGDHSNGIVYEMSPDIYHDFGFPIYYERRAPHIVESNHRLSLDRFELGIETGVGLITPLWLQSFSLQRPDFATALAAAVVATTVTAAQALVLQDIYDLVPYVPLATYPDADTMNALGFYPWGATATLTDGTIVGEDPMMSLEYSTDGGKSYSSELKRSLGAASDDLDVFWNSLGTGKDRVTRIYGDHPCKLAITNCWLELEEIPQ